MEDISEKNIQLERVHLDNEDYFRISNVDEMRPFFMSIVSDTNHWMFISSNGGLSAGRKDAENALFPYYTDDKITEAADITGSKSVFHIQKEGKSHLWEPFSNRYEGRYKLTRNLYKNVYGNKIIFEEINHNLGLIFRYQWSSSNKFGFVKKSTLINSGEEEIEISMLDGLQNIMPYGVSSALQKQSSNLVDAYKRSELDKSSGLGIFALSAIIVDKAEPSEALKANVVWSLGIDRPKYLMSSLQLKNFRRNIPIVEEEDVKAEKGAYFINGDLVLSAKESKEWMIIADVNKNHSTIAQISGYVKNNAELIDTIQNDIDKGTSRLIELVAAADGLQLSADSLRDARHYSNCLFNIMRGGIFDNNYQIEKSDFTNYLSNANKEVFNSHSHLLEEFPDVFSLSAIRETSSKEEDSNFIRLCLEYLPLKFSRRHGDPSRPWNQFSINTQSEIDGSKILDYEGNWRDIFQNWEALGHSYPEFLEGMIHKFLNATTFDGYNPYRITKGGIDWEIIEPDDPWSYIGYWGDHQIIYLLKFLEIIEEHYPGNLNSYFNKELFAYANVPYRIKKYEDILKNPKDTIDFDHSSDQAIREKMSELGADGALLCDQNGLMVKANFIEKILATVLSKISNFIPGGGIWMNTQRPEWNDANNALVGNGVSMVTLYYLRRFLAYFESLISQTDLQEVAVSIEIIDLFNQLNDSLDSKKHLLSNTLSNKDRKIILDELGEAGSKYRQNVYRQSFSGKKKTISLDGLNNFLKLSNQYLEHSIQSNLRTDQLYHAYNLMTVDSKDEVSLAHLSEMLEGQVAVLSSGYLKSKEVLDLLDSLKSSALFREDQYSYLLYPKKQLPGFLEKNTIPEESVNSSELFTQLISDGNSHVIEKDLYGAFHFNGNFKNAGDLETALDQISQMGYASLVLKERLLVLQIFEQVFNHKAFTGRSGTFYGYEGLGSIYWHMVSKLQLAVFECCMQAIDENEGDEIIGRLIEHYYEINEGIGVHKHPDLYGAFPTDPYSHTPAGKGAQQPGMTGQVKEDILSRFGELGVFVRNGSISFNPCLLRKNEFLKESKTYEYVDVNSVQRQFKVDKDSLCFTYCQVPIIYKISENNRIEVVSQKQTFIKIESLKLDDEISKQIFKRTGDIKKIIVEIRKSQLI